MAEKVIKKLDVTKLRLVSVSNTTVADAFADLYEGLDLFDHGGLMYVWHRPKTYSHGNGPVNMIVKDSLDQFWIFTYGYEKYLDPSEPYKEYSGDVFLRGSVVEPAFVLPQVALVCYQP